MSLAKNILVGTDFSDAARGALEHAVALARPLGAKVTLAHAYELPIIGLPDAGFPMAAELSARVIDAAQEEIDRLAAAHASSGVELTTCLQQGDPRDAILAVAKATGADLIVVGTHGRRGVARLLIGSVAEGIVRRSTVPVLVVPPAGRPA